MALVIGMPVSDLLTVGHGNKAFGFGKTYYPQSNGADGMRVIEANDSKPQWVPNGPFNSKGRGEVITHLEIKRDKVIVNRSHVYDRAGFIALAAPILNDPVEDKPYFESETNERMIAARKRDDAKMALLGMHYGMRGKRAVNHAGLDNATPIS